ncbi:hypothetical protein ABZ131_21010 [Providencia rettgeri]
MSKSKSINKEVLNFRESVETVVSLLASKKIRVVDFGNEAYCAYDKKTGELEYINIPSIPDNASNQLLTAIRGFIDHEVAHVLFTDISISKMMDGKKAHSLWNVIEDTYIERKMSSLFPGSRKNLLQTQIHIIDSFLNKRIGEFIAHFGDNSKDLFLSVFLMPVSRAYCGHTPFIDFMDKYWDRFENEINILNSINYKTRINRISKSEGAAKLAVDVIKAFRIAEEKDKKKGEETEKPTKSEKDAPEKTKSDADDLHDSGDSDLDEPIDDSIESCTYTDTEESEKRDEEDTETKITEDELSEPIKDEKSDEEAPPELESKEEKDAKSISEPTLEPSDSETDIPKPMDESIEPPIDDRESFDTKDTDLEKDKTDDDLSEEIDSKADMAIGAEGKSDISDSLDTGRETHTADADETPLSESEDIESDIDGTCEHDDSSSEPKTTDDETLSDSDKEELDAEDAPETLSTEDASKDMISDEIKTISSYDYKPFSRTNDFIGLLENAASFFNKATKTLGDARWAEISPSNYTLEEKEALNAFRRYIEPKLTSKSKTLAKDLERVIASKNRVQKVNGLRKGKINSSSLWKITCPTINDDRVFSKKHDHKAVNAAVQLVVDLSGSMSGRRVHLALAAAYALSDALDKIKVPNIITGFTTAGVFKGASGASRYEPLFMPTLKNWNEKANSTTCMARLGFTSHGLPLLNNADGECILALSQHHAGRMEDKQIMFVLSDGAPCALGSGFGKHLLDVVNFITTKTKIDILAVGIQTDAPRNYYRHNTTVDSVDDLPKTVIAAIRNLLLGQPAGF